MEQYVVTDIMIYFAITLCDRK